MNQSMSGPDGQEQREAERQEQSWRDEARIEQLEDAAEAALMDIARDRIDSFAVSL